MIRSIQSSEIIENDSNGMIYSHCPYHVFNLSKRFNFSNCILVFKYYQILYVTSGNNGYGITIITTPAICWCYHIISRSKCI